MGMMRSLERGLLANSPKLCFECLSYLCWNLFKSSDHVLIAKEILKSEDDENKMFRDLDKSGYVCSLGSPMSPPRANLLVTIPQSLPESEDATSSDMHPFDNVI